MASPINATDVKLHLYIPDADADAALSGFTTVTNFSRLAGLTSLTIDLSKATIDVTTKGNDGMSSLLSGLKEGTISFSGVVDLSVGADTTLTPANSTSYTLSLVDFVDVFNAADAKQIIGWRITNEQFDATASPNVYIGGDRFESLGVLESFTFDTPMEDVTTFEGSIKIDGQVKQFGKDTATS